MLLTEWKYVCHKCCSHEEFAQAESEQHLPVGFNVRRTEGLCLAFCCIVHKIDNIGQLAVGFFLYLSIVWQYYAALIHSGVWGKTSTLGNSAQWQPPTLCLHHTATQYDWMLSWYCHLSVRDRRCASSYSKIAWASDRLEHDFITFNLLHRPWVPKNCCIMLVRKSSKQTGIKSRLVWNIVNK